MSILHFTKAQGAGNDFVILDEPLDLVKTRDQAAQLCRRHTGIGADGVIWLSPVDAQRAQVVFFNADGSRPEVCGNGLRCAAHFLHTRRQMPAEMYLLTDAGPRCCKVELCGDEKRAQVEIEMGRVEALGMDEADLRSRHLDPIGAEIEVHALSVGNPHLVILQGADIEIVESQGPSLSRHAAFAVGCNVEWVQRLGADHVRVEVYERGVGRTLACGSGACAAVAALVRGGHMPPGLSCRVDLPGGQLRVCVNEHGAAHLTGPSQLVFAGQIELPLT